MACHVSDSTLDVATGGAARWIAALYNGAEANAKAESRLVANARFAMRD